MTSDIAPAATGFQSFVSTASPEQGPPRVAALRAQMTAEGLDAFIVPRADVHQGEYVAPRDERLAWLTGFTGSAGFAAVLADEAGLFVDGRYTVQARAQVDTEVITPVDWPKTRLGPWLAERLERGAVVAFDPWLHTAKEIETLREALEPKGVALRETDNLVDRVWEDQPEPPQGQVSAYPDEFAGRTHGEKRQAAADALREAGQKAAVLTLPDSIAWLLNIRGADLPRVPVAQAFCILHDTGHADMFVDAAKVDEVRDHLGDEVTVHAPKEFAAALEGLDGPVRVDKATAPLAVSRLLDRAGVEVTWGDDPCILPKARKSGAEIAATTKAHLRDAAAMCHFLAWLDAEAEGLDRDAPLTEIDVVRRLEAFRRDTNALRDISFDTIAGAGPHAALPHYRVTEESNRAVQPGELLLVDSGGQYVDGTTDITRTVAVGAPSDEHRACFTRVLQGMIAVSRARWPRGLAGRDLDALARAPLWMAGQDYDHGTGHGVGVYLSVHEGPQRLSRISDVPLEPGMILSNEPGYYREGAFGIRIENLIVVETAPALAGGDDRDMLHFATLTWVPIDRRLIDTGMLSRDERAWIDAYHAEVARKVAPRLDGAAAAWLARATAPV